MNVELILAAIRRKPFKPFGIHTGFGEDYPVSHPENILASPKFETVFVKYGSGQAAIIDLESITEITYPPAKRSRKE